MCFREELSFAHDGAHQQDDCDQHGDTRNRRKEAKCVAKGVSRRMDDGGAGGCARCRRERQAAARDSCEKWRRGRGAGADGDDGGDADGVLTSVVIQETLTATDDLRRGRGDVDQEQCSSDQVTLTERDLLTTAGAE